MALGHDLVVSIAFLEPLQDSGATKDSELDVESSIKEIPIIL